MARYARPATLDEALGLLAQGGWTVVAGGTDVYPAKADAVLRTDMLDITALPLRGIARQPDGWRIGALTTWTDVVCAGLPSGLAVLVEAAREVGSVQIQNAATVAGNIVNASPAADGTVALIALGATVEIAGGGATRRVPLEDFVTGPRQVALRPGELVLAAHVPDPGPGARSGFAKLGARRYLVISIAMAAAAIAAPGGVVQSARVVIGACSPVARRMRDLEERMIGLHISDVAAAIEAEDSRVLSPISDIRADRAYRLQAAPELVRRLLRRIAEDAE
ncbi:MAG: FAD binding domain-containing protein [Gemmobacter sp.]